MNNIAPLINEIRERVEKLSIPSKMNGSFGYYYIDLDKILFLESNNNTTVIHFEEETPITVVKILKFFESELLGKSFLRIHKSYIINVRKLYKYNKGKKKYVILTNGQKIDVSRSKQNALEKNIIEKLIVPDYEGIVYVDYNSILYLEANHDKTIIYLMNGHSVKSMKNIDYFEKALTEKSFFRIHDKHIINLKNVMKYYRGSNKISETTGKTSGCVVLNTGTVLPVASSKKELFLRFFRD